jgi:hypothetical protein
VSYVVAFIAGLVVGAFTWWSGYRYGLGTGLRALRVATFARRAAEAVITRQDQDARAARDRPFITYSAEGLPLATDPGHPGATPPTSPGDVPEVAGPESPN